MNSTLLLTLCIGLLARGANADFSKGGSFCSDEQNRFDTCKPLVAGPKPPGSKEKSEPPSSNENSVPSSAEVSASGSGSGSGSCSCAGSGSGSGMGSGSDSMEVSGSGSGIVGASGSGSGEANNGFAPGQYCFLLEAFLNFSLTLTVEEQMILVQWINITQETIVEDSSLTEYQMLVEIWYSLQILFQENAGIKAAIEYDVIPGWGLVIDLEGLAIDIQSEETSITVQDVVTVGNGGSCPLIAALQNASESAGSMAESNAIEQLIQQIEIILNGSVSFDVQMVEIYSVIEAFIQANPSYASDLYSIQIQGFGIFQSFFDISATYFRIDNFQMAVGGAGNSSGICQALIALYQNTSIPLSERSDIKQLEVDMEDFSAENSSTMARVEYFQAQLYQLFILEPWMAQVIYSAEITGYGSIYEFIYAFTYSQNFGIGADDFTTAPTTAAPTTSVPNGNCANVESVNVYSVTSNTTILLTAIKKAQMSWTSAQKNQFQGYFNRIYNYSANTTLTAVQVFTSIQTVLTGCGTANQASVYPVFISGWGTVAEYVQCNANNIQ